MEFWYTAADQVRQPDDDLEANPAEVYAEQGQSLIPSGDLYRGLVSASEQVE